MSGRIDVAGVRKSFGSFTALENLDLVLEQGEIVCIVGPSGCGKTTLLNIVAGFDAATDGSVEVAGKPVKGPGPQRGFVFQKPALFPWMTVMENVGIGPTVAGKGQRAWKARAGELLAATGLSRFADNYPYQISGGMAQRTQLVRVMMNEPDVVLMDEPFGALDYQTRLHMHALLLDLHSRLKPTILFITHDVDEAIFLADRVCVMSRAPGRVEHDIRIELERPRSLKMLSGQRFTDYKTRILDLLGFH